MIYLYILKTFENSISLIEKGFNQIFKDFWLSFLSFSVNVTRYLHYKKQKILTFNILLHTKTKSNVKIFFLLLLFLCIGRECAPNKIISTPTEPPKNFNLSLMKKILVMPLWIIKFLIFPNSFQNTEILSNTLISPLSKLENQKISKL